LLLCYTVVFLQESRNAAQDVTSGTSLQTCPGSSYADYTVTFCPPSALASSTASQSVSAIATSGTITGIPSSATLPATTSFTSSRSLETSLVSDFLITNERGFQTLCALDPLKRQWCEYHSYCKDWIILGHCRQYIRIYALSLVFLIHDFDHAIYFLVGYHAVVLNLWYINTRIHQVGSRSPVRMSNRPSGESVIITHNFIQS
jgi:hypothetical protein